MPDNKMQVQAVTKIFDTVASHYDCPALRFFPMVADQLIARIKPASSSKHLDIATGTGMVAIAACQAVGQSGRVTGIDLSENMLQQAQKNLSHRGYGNIDFHQMDAGDLEFKDRYFDSASCSFGIFFLPDPAKALKSWLRVLKPGATIGLTTFGVDAMMPMMQNFLQQVESMDISILGSKKIEAFRNPEHCLQLLTDAGFQNAACETKQMGYHLAKAEDWWEMLYHSGTRGLIEQIPAERLSAFMQQQLQQADSMKTCDGIWLNLPIHFFTATKKTL